MYLYHRIPNKINPTKLIAKFANICTIQEEYIFSFFSFKKLNITPPTINPIIIRKKVPIENHPIIMAM